jgi:hypothetical protein
MKKFAALVFGGFLFGCLASADAHPTTLHSSSMTFKQAESACAGALGSITFALGHARAHAASGVDMREQSPSPSGIATITFSDKAKGKSATVSVNGHNRSVSGKHVTAKKSATVACVSAD